MAFCQDCFALTDSIIDKLNKLRTRKSINGKWTAFIKHFSSLSTTKSALQHKSAFNHLQTHDRGVLSLKCQPAHRELIHTQRATEQLFEAIWGSVTCSEALPHADWRSSR